jgi:ferrous iron transport protein B
MAARVIENRRDRLATILVAPLMTCSARLPVYALLIGAFLTVGYAWWVPGLTMFALYALGLVIAPLVALLLKRTLLRGETPVFVMEMPIYKWPSPRLVLRRMTDSGWAFVRRAGTLILASMVLVWALLSFPYHDAQGQSYYERIAAAQEPVKEQKAKLKGLEDGIAPHRRKIQRLRRQETNTGDAERDAVVRRREELERVIEPEEKKIAALKKVVDPADDEVNQLREEWNRQSYLGQLGQVLEPAAEPLGWDWRVTVATLASFPAREVVVGTLGIVYKVGEVKSDEIRDADDPGATELGQVLRAAEWDGQPGRKVFTVPVVLSILVFFALCCQCASTLAVIRRETNSWCWPLFTFVYMTVLAYIGALAVFQLGSLLL